MISLDYSSSIFNLVWITYIKLLPGLLNRYKRALIQACHISLLLRKILWESRTITREQDTRRRYTLHLDMYCKLRGEKSNIAVVDKCECKMVKIVFYTLLNQPLFHFSCSRGHITGGLKWYFMVRLLRKSYKNYSKNLASVSCDFGFPRNLPCEYPRIISWNTAWLRQTRKDFCFQKDAFLSEIIRVKQTQLCTWAQVIIFKIYALYCFSYILHFVEKWISNR